MGLYFFFFIIRKMNSDPTQSEFINLLGADQAAWFDSVRSARGGSSGFAQP